MIKQNKMNKKNQQPTIMAKKVDQTIAMQMRGECYTFRYSRAEEYDKQEGSRSLNAFQKKPYISDQMLARKYHSTFYIYPKDTAEWQVKYLNIKANGTLNILFMHYYIVENIQ